MTGFSRRGFLQGSVAGGVLGRSRSAPAPGISVTVPAPAGPAPGGAPATTSVPFPRGAVRPPAHARVTAPSGRAVPAQARATGLWPDGSVRWLYVIFEAEEGPGDYTVTPAQNPPGGDLIAAQPSGFVLDSGLVRLVVPRSGWIRSIEAAGPDGWREVVSGDKLCDLILTPREGPPFRASLGLARAQVEDRGPLYGGIRLDGVCRTGAGAPGFDYILRLAMFRGRPELHISVTWINTSPREAEQMRDMRLVFPFQWRPESLVVGCERGVYDGPYLKDWPVWITQEDAHRYWARTLNPDGRVQNLATGGANGEVCPGWVQLAARDRALGVWVRDFREKYPSEIAVRGSELSIGLWPERAASHLKSEPLLPRDPFHDKPYRMTRYWPVMPHPYTAFVAPEDGCLDAPQGVAMTEDVVLAVWGGTAGGPLLERKIRHAALVPVRGHVDPKYLGSTAAVGILSPPDPNRDTALEQMFDENYGWFERHAAEQRAFGKFDYGDFRYITAGTDYLTTPGSKWGEMGEMAREGYWHNNERDPLRGLILHYARKPGGEAWALCERAARHALNVDLRHHPHWGMWTHSYGHCYLALGEGGEPDHSWLLGLLDWAGMSGDTLAAEWVLRCGERLASLRIDFEQADARTAAVFLHMMVQFHLHTGAVQYLERASAPVAAFRKLQNENGSWPAYLGNMKQPRLEGFVEHAVMALADYYRLRREQSVRESIDRALRYLFGADGAGKVDPGESGLAVYALAAMWEATGELQYAKVARKVLYSLREHLNVAPDPSGRGDLWSAWGPNRTKTPGSDGRRPQLLGQTRPLAPATMLAYAQPAMAALASLPGE